MRNMDQITPIIDTFGVSKWDTWIEAGDDSDAVCLMYQQRMIAIHFGKVLDTIGVFVHETKVDPFDHDIDAIPIELAAEICNECAFSKIKNAENLSQKVDIYCKISEKYVLENVGDPVYYDKLKIFNSGFLVGYTSAFT